MASSRVAATGTAAPEALVESYRRLAEVFHDVLSEQSLSALLDRLAGTLSDLVPYDSLIVYEADERRRKLRPVLARDPYADKIMETTTLTISGSVKQTAGIAAGSKCRLLPAMISATSSPCAAALCSSIGSPARSPMAQTLRMEVRH